MNEGEAEDATGAPVIAGDAVVDEAVDGAGTGATSAGSARALRRLVVVLALAIVALGGWLAVTLDELTERRERSADRAAVTAVAGQLATALFSYDHRDLDAGKERVLKLSTGAFRKEYEDGFVAIEELVTKAQATSEASVSEVFVSSIDGAEATCIVLVDTTVTGLAGRRSESSYTRLSFVKVGETWRVDGVLALGAGTSRPPSDAAETVRGPIPTPAG